MATGVFRIKNEGLENGVWVTAGKVAVEVPESRYRRDRHSPAVDTLPWGKAPEHSTSGEDIGSGDIASLSVGPSTDDDRPLE
jgi:hypothetical protein